MFKPVSIINKNADQNNRYYGYIIFPLKNRYDAYERIIESTTPCVAVIHLGVKPHLFRQRSRHRGTERQFTENLVINNVSLKYLRIILKIVHNLIFCTREHS